MGGAQKPVAITDAAWDILEGKVVECILTCLGGDMKKKCAGIEDPQQLWNFIAEQYQSGSGVEKAHYLCKLVGLCNPEKDSDGFDAKEYVRKFSELKTKCQEVRWRFSDDVIYWLEVWLMKNHSP